MSEIFGRAWSLIAFATFFVTPQLSHARALSSILVGVIGQDRWDRTKLAVDQYRTFDLDQILETGIKLNQSIATCHIREMGYYTEKLQIRLSRSVKEFDVASFAKAYLPKLVVAEKLAGSHKRTADNKPCHDLAKKVVDSLDVSLRARAVTKGLNVPFDLAGARKKLGEQAESTAQVKPLVERSTASGGGEKSPRVTPGN